MTLWDVRYLSNETADAFMAVAAIKERARVLQIAQAFAMDTQQAERLAAEIQYNRSGVREDVTDARQRMLNQSIASQMGFDVGVSDDALAALGIVRSQKEDQ